MSRRFLIRVMLWSLGATAVAGAGAALMGGHEVGWRIVGTGVITAVAAGFLLPFTIMADKPPSRREGLLGMALVIVEFIAALGLIWRFFEAFSSGGMFDLEARVGATMFFLAIVALPAILFLRISARPIARIAGHVAVTAAMSVFVLLMLGTWSSSGSTFEDEFFSTAGAVSVFGLLATAALVGLGTPPRRWWRWIGVLVSIACLVVSIVAIWRDLHSNNGIFAVIVSIAAAVAYVNLFLLIPLTPPQRWVRVVTIIAALLTAALVDVICLADQYDYDQLRPIHNIAAACGIIASCGSLALLVLARINRNLDRKVELSEITQVTIICPGCKKKQTLGVGESRCPGCLLKFNITVEEPRCPNCDYLLFMLQSDRCPECGTPIDTAFRGVSAEART